MTMIGKDKETVMSRTLEEIMFPTQEIQVDVNRAFNECRDVIFFTDYDAQRYRRLLQYVSELEMIINQEAIERPDFRDKVLAKLELSKHMIENQG